jgi:hypothetical protein
MQYFKDFSKNYIVPSALILILFFAIYLLAYPLNIFVIKQFIASPIFNPLMTILVGSTALIIYNKTKDDSKKDAANIVLLEIQNAERLLKQIMVSINSDPPTLPQNIFLMQTESWSKYRYLFVRDFDWNEWNEITDFYNIAQQYDQAVVYNNSFFPKNEEQIRVNLQRIAADYARKYTKKIFPLSNIDENRIKLHEEFVALNRQFRDRYMGEDSLYLYSPKKPVSDAKLILNSMNTNISLTTIGTKLKKLANRHD